MNGKIFPTVITCILFAAFCLFAMADETESGQKVGSDEAAMKDQAGKVIIRSLPLECEVSFRGQDIHKVEDQITIEGIPAGSYPIIFKLGDKMLKAELDIRAGAALLVNCRFKRGDVSVTSGVFVGKDGAAMVLIPAGEFQMGSDVGEPDEEPVHEVYIDAFYMDVYEVTNALYKKFMDATGHKTPKYWSDPRCNAPDQPVVGINWHDAKAYCEWAGKRLPTEAEWEKAARGELVGKIYPWGDNITQEREDGSTATGMNKQGKALPVAGFAPNGYGLHDMGGNAWEWCADWYGEAYYAESPDRNPAGPSSRKTRVMRGGTWFADIYAPLPVSYRYSYNPKNTSDLIGFRCVR